MEAGSKDVVDGEQEGGDGEGYPFVGDRFHEIAEDIASEYQLFAKGDEDHPAEREDRKR